MKCFTPVLANFFLVIVGLLGFFSGNAKAYVVDQTVAAVNDDVILESDLEKFSLKVKSKSFQELFGGLDPKALQTREAILQLLIEEKIINQQVKKLELGASDQEVDGQIHAIVSRNGITEDQLKSRLSQLGTTLGEYREGIRRQIERKNLIEREIKPMMEVSDEQLRHYYLRHLKPEDQETSYEIAQLLVEDKVKGGISAEQRAHTVWEEVVQHPGEFEKYVKDYSDDQDTAATGGKLGSFTLSSLAKEFRAEVPKTPIGGITKPIKTAAGYHILKVLNTAQGDFNSLTKERKEALRNQMAQGELESKMQMWLERRKRDSYITRFSGNKNEAK